MKVAYGRLAAQLNVIARVKKENREIRGEVVDWTCEEETITVDKLMSKLGRTQTDGCATQRKANRSILDILRNAVETVMVLEEQEMDEFDFQSFYCFLHIAMNMVGAVDRGLAAADKDELLGRFGSTGCDGKSVLAQEFRDSPSDKVGVGSAGVWAVCKLLSDKGRNCQVGRGWNYEAAMARRPLSDDFELVPFAALLGNRQIARLQNAVRIRQMMVSKAIGCAYCTECIQQFPALATLVTDESRAGVPCTSKWCAVHFIRRKFDGKENVVALNLLDKATILYLTSDKFLAHVIVYDCAWKMIVMPMVKKTASLRAMEVVQYSSTCSTGLAAAAADPTSYLRGEKRILNDYGVVTMVVKVVASLDDKVAKLVKAAADRIIYIEGVVDTAQEVYDAQLGLDNTVANEERVVKTIAAIAAYTVNQELGDFDNKRLVAAVCIRKVIDRGPLIDIIVQVHKPDRPPENMLAGLPPIIQTMVIDRAKTAFAEASSTFDRQAAEYLRMLGPHVMGVGGKLVPVVMAGAPVRYNEQERRDLRIKHGSAPATAAASESILGMVDYSTRIAWQQRTLYASCLAQVRKNGTLVHHQALKATNPAAAAAEMQAARVGGKKLAMGDKKRRQDISDHKAAVDDARRTRRKTLDGALAKRRKDVLDTKLVLDVPGLQKLKSEELQAQLRAWKTFYEENDPELAKLKDFELTKNMPGLTKMPSRRARVTAVVEALTAGHRTALIGLGRAARTDHPGNQPATQPAAAAAAEGNAQTTAAAAEGNAQTTAAAAEGNVQTTAPKRQRNSGLPEEEDLVGSEENEQVSWHEPDEQESSEHKSYDEQPRAKKGRWDTLDSGVGAHRAAYTERRRRGVPLCKGQGGCGAMNPSNCWGPDFGCG